ncbi:unnamed protein product [Tenebrio molitor]|nr:unnamed protein product [Tenebrio molitor]
MVDFIVDNFLRQFHSLEGTRIAQKKRSFFKLLHENADNFWKSMAWSW